MIDSHCLIDSHCHLDASEFASDLPAVLAKAFRNGISRIINPAVEVGNFALVAALSQTSIALNKVGSSPLIYYALGIHPVFTHKAKPEDVGVLRQTVVQALDDPMFVGIGEIGLDGFVPGLDPITQEFFFVEQLKIAKEFGLPVIMHVRHAQDQILKQLRRFKPIAGIAHAFNGSEQQAKAFIGCDCVLGFGGAMTFTRALQIRCLAAVLPPEAIVLETDSPDISPSWLHPRRNEPGEIARIAQVLSELRRTDFADVARFTTINVERVLPRVGLPKSIPMAKPSG
jgi:TatD DNase family protein